MPITTNRYRCINDFKKVTHSIHAKKCNNDNLHRKQILRRHFWTEKRPREVFFFLAARHLVNSNPKQVCKEMITHQWNECNV